MFPKADSVIAHVVLLDAGPEVVPSSASTKPEDDHSPDIVLMKDVENNERRYSSDSSGVEPISNSPLPFHEMNPKDEKNRVEPPHAMTLDKCSEVQDSTELEKLKKEEMDADDDLSATGRGGKDVEVEHIYDNHIVGNSFTTGETKVLV